MKKNMVLLRRAAFMALSVIIIFSALALINTENARISAQQRIGMPGQNFVIMELFTSQGCSSCPPADALLAEYASAHNDNIIPLSFHVDYWNRLGWTDPFSKSAYSARQQWYSQHLPQHSVYTPQLVVNGKSEAVGNNRNAVKGLVQKELTARSSAGISIEEATIGKNAVIFHYKTTGTGQYDVLNIALVQKKATTRIKSGEQK